MSRSTRLNGTLRTKDAATQYALTSDLAAATSVLAASFNIIPATTRKLRAGLAKVRANTASTRWLIVGDSTSWGAGSDGYGASGYRNSRSSWPALFVKTLASYFAPARYTLAVPPSKNDGTATDSRWAAGTGWALAFAGFGQMSAYQAPAGVVTPLTLTPDALNCDTFDVYWVRNTGLGGFGVKVDAGSTTTVSCAGAGAVMKTTITATAGSSHVLTITPDGTGSGIYVVGVDAYLSTENVIRVANAGVSSSRAADWSTGSGGGALGAIGTYAPDLTIIMLGINDSKGPRTDAQYIADLTAMVQRAQLSGDAILLSVVPSQLTGTVGSPDYVAEAAYRDDAKALATTLGCGYINIYDRFQSYAISNAAGYMQGDGIHLTTFGYADLAAAVFAAIRGL